MALQAAVTKFFRNDHFCLIKYLCPCKTSVTMYVFRAGQLYTLMNSVGWLNRFMGWPPRHRPEIQVEWTDDDSVLVECTCDCGIVVCFESDADSTYVYTT